MKYLPILFLLVPVLSNAQIDIATHYSSLEIEEKESITFHGDTLLIDTLKMYDNSKIILTSDCYVQIKHAFLGESVSIENHGIEGERGIHGRRTRIQGFNGAEGSSGGNITMFIRIEALGSLSISTLGGDGGNGGQGFRYPPNPVSGERGYDGGNGGNGGDGGNGGNIYFNYQVRKGFVPIFNGKNRLRSINLIANGGNGGSAGQGGPGGRGGKAEYVRGPNPASSYWIIAGENGANGISGSIGSDGQTGNIKIEKRS